MRTKSFLGGASAWVLVATSLVLCFVAYQAVKFLTRAPSTEAQTEKAPVVTVGVAEVSRQSWEETVSLNGTVTARELLQVSSELSGLQIVEILVDEGDVVVQGELLARLNTDLLEARRLQLQARYQQQQAAVAKARNPQRPLEVAQLESGLRQAQAMVSQEEANLAVAEAAYQNAKANHQRYQELFSRGAIPATEAENRRLELQRQEGSVKSAQDRLKSAQMGERQSRERLALAQQGGRSEDITIATAQLSELSAQIQEVQTQIDQARIVAPRRGLVLSRQASLGQIVTPGTVLFELAQDSQLELKGELPATQVAHLTPEQRVQVSSGEHTVEGKIWKVSPKVDSRTRNAQVRIALPPDPVLKPGMFAQATVTLEPDQELVIPLEALYGESQQRHVFLLNQDQTVTRQAVEIGARKSGLVAVEKGLQSGQKIVVSGGGFLSDGDRVALP